MDFEPLNRKQTVDKLHKKSFLQFPSCIKV